MNTNPWLIADPPAPPGINQFPAGLTDPEEVFQVDLPDEIIDLSGQAKRPLKSGYIKRKLTVLRQWHALLSATVEPGGSVSRTIAVVTGVTSSRSDTDQFSVSIGSEVGATFEGIGAKLTSTISRSTSTTYTVTLTQQTTDTQTVSITGVTQQTTIIWWQLLERYEISGEPFVEDGGQRVSAGPNAVYSRLSSSTPIFVQSCYPSKSGSVQMGGKVLS